MSGTLAGGPLPSLVGTHSPSTEEYKHLPLGRWSCTETDIVRAFDVTRDQRRIELWDGWKQHLELVRSTVGTVAACWLSGTFFTSKAHPGDIDCVYIVPAEQYRQLNQQQLQQWQFAFAGKAAHGLDLDAFPLLWDPHPGAVVDTQGSSEYVYYRGYWDDLWSRMRGPNRSPDPRPRRGFVEVIVDGYQ